MYIIRGCLPPEMSVGEDQSHQGHVGSHSETAQAEDECRLLLAAWVTVEHSSSAQRHVVTGRHGPIP